MDKVAKGWYCAACSKELMDADLKAGACPGCEKKPARAEYCSRTAGKTVDRARVSYACAGCEQTADVEADLKHREDCKKKSVKKVCPRTGTPPHATAPR